MPPPPARPLICLFVLDDETPGEWEPGGGLALVAASFARQRWTNRWQGPSGACAGARRRSVIKALVQETGADTVMWNRCYEPFAVERDKALKSELTAQGVTVESFNGVAAV